MTSIRPEPTRITPEAVIHGIENPHDRRILALAQTRAVTAQEIIDETDVPRSSAYRRIDQLQEWGLIEVVGGVMREGHPMDTYRARLELAQVTIEEGDVNAAWRLLETPEERLHRLWTSLR